MVEHDVRELLGQGLHVVHVTERGAEDDVESLTDEVTGVVAEVGGALRDGLDECCLHAGLGCGRQTALIV